MTTPKRLPEREASARLADLKVSLRLHHRITRRIDLFPAWRELESPLILAKHAQYLPGDLRQRYLRSVCEDIREFTDHPEEKALMLAQLAPFSREEVTTIFDIVKTAWWPEADLIVAGVLAPYLHDKRLLLYATSRVTAFPLEEECFEALAQLGVFQTPTARDGIAERALALADGISYRGKKARAVAALAPIMLRPDLAARAFEIARSTGPYWVGRALDPLAQTLPVDLLQAIPDAISGPSCRDPALVIPRTLERLSAEEHATSIDILLPMLREPEDSLPHDQCEKIMHLAPYLSASQAHRLWRIGDPEILGHSQAEALSALTSRLPEHERAAAVDELIAAYAIYTTRYSKAECEARVLGQLAQAASTQRLTQALHEFLTCRADSLAFTVIQEFVPYLPDAIIEEMFRYAVSGDYESSSALAKLAPRLSGSLLTQAISHVSGQNGCPPGKAAALVALAQQLPPRDRETVLTLALETTVSCRYESWQDGVMADLILQLPEGLRARAVEAATGQACSEVYLRWDGETLDRLQAIVAVLRGPELEHLYIRLGKDVKSPRSRARAQAAMIRQTACGHGTSCFFDGRMYQDWPGDFDRAGLMDLIGASAWWIHRNGSEPAVEEVVEAIFDAILWWSSS